MLDEHALNAVLVDLYEDLKLQNQKIVLLEHRLDVLGETLSKLLPEFRRTQGTVAQTLSEGFPAKISSEDRSYTEAIQKVKSGELFHP